jgi:putative membrane protein
MSISAQDRDRIASAIHAAEAKTSGEIVCVLARSSSGATALPVFIAAVLALALPWLLVETTAMPVFRILSLQIALFVAATVVLCLPRLRAMLIPPAARRAVAHRAALEQFAVRGVAHTKDRSGVLIFVSLAERYARIIADDGIAARVAQAEWQGAIDDLIAHMRDGRIADGYIAAIEVCGKVLATHFPSHETNRDELRDRIYLV